MTHQHLYQGAILLLLVFGLITAAAFIGQHRPRQWRRLAAWDASGWVLLVALFFFRQIVLVVTRWPGSAPLGWFDGVFSIGLLVLIDALLVVRVVSFRSFAQRDAERIRDGRTDAIT